MTDVLTFTDSASTASFNPHFVENNITSTTTTTTTTASNNNNNNNNNSRSRSRRTRSNRSTPSSFARIDDNNEGGIETNSSQSSHSLASSHIRPSRQHSQPTVSNNNDRRNDSRRKGKRVDRNNGIASQKDTPVAINSNSSPHKHQSYKTERNNNSSSSSGSNNRRQRSQRNEASNRILSSRGSSLSSPIDSTADVPTASGPSQIPHQRHAANNSSKNNKRHVLRQPPKFVNKVEEDRNLMEALTVGLTNSTYECMVCWDVVRPAHRIWNCQVCWAAFHLDCLSTWAKKSSSDSNGHGEGWRCPGCQNTQISLPKEYTCFCGKTANPEYNRYFTPHSCGELCGRSRDCPHSCSLPCHPGPCPPCSGMGPTQSCYCGNETFQLRCVDTDFTFQTGQSCQKVCGELLGCGKHSCASVCHPGLCAPCEEEEIQHCYCGKHERRARCGEGEPRKTLVDGDEINGFFECKEICKRLFACGHHECTKKCHPISKEPSQCPASPELVKTCPCGAKPISLLLNKARKTCMDPVPVCDGGICKKVLSCGHQCMQKCHTGKCAPCKTVVRLDCRCGSTHVEKVCSDRGLYQDKQLTCEKPCRALRTCGKHQCTNRCCPAKNQKQSRISQESNSTLMEAHACTLVCGKKLRCGVHTCEMSCHKGHCNPCLEASIDDLSCACGRTVVFAPIPCGTPIPKCKYSCTRTRECGHASFTSHPCHPDTEPCPPCTIMTSKQCMCSKAVMPNVPCYVLNPSCGKICGKVLDCGLHKCPRSCHSGECSSSSSLPSSSSRADKCSQPCSKPRKSCGHRCTVACHGQDPCLENQPCQALVVSTCKCGYLTKEVPCHGSSDNPWDGKPRIIKCNDYCLVAERNRRVALALDIDTGIAKSPRIPNYDDYVLDYASANMEFTLKIEKRLADWVADSSSQLLNLPPMKGHHRKFVHELATHYNVTSESVDAEPYRSVVIHKKLNTSVPDLLASQACRQRRTAAAVNSNGNSSTGGVEQLRKSNIKDPVNAIYLHDLVFGLTRIELSTQLAPIFGNIKYGLRWLTDDDVVLVPRPGNMSMDELENVLIRLRTGIKSLISNGQLCDRVELCWVNKEGDVVGGSLSSYSKRFFSVTQGNELAKKAAPAKIENAFAVLDEDEKIAARKRLEEERIMKAKEAAGTLSLEAWEEDEANVSFSSTTSSSSKKSSPVVSKKRSITNDRHGSLSAAQEVVDDWQELIDNMDD